MEKDVSWKEYFRDDERYADVINGIGFGGRESICMVLGRTAGSIRW